MNMLYVCISKVLPPLVSAVIFSFFINILLFVTPIYMLQIYDRVITSRNEFTLIGISTISFALLIIYATLEMLRS
jgi:ATP-binding cassette subfamily C protein